MTSLLLPPNVAEARRRQLASVASSIQASGTNSLTSDDFVTSAQVIKQIGQLHEYIAERRSKDPKYDIPVALGWRLTVLMLTIDEVTDGGVHIVDEAREARSMSSPQGVVLHIGRNAYGDGARFAVDGQIEPWCKVGDRIIWKKYDVTTFQLANGQRLGFMNDTQPVGLIDRGWLIEEN